jgi:hypothetical protein
MSRDKTYFGQCLGLEPSRALHMLGKHSTSELHSKPNRIGQGMGLVCLYLFMTRYNFVLGRSNKKDGFGFFFKC